MISKVSKVFDYSAIASGIVLFLLAVLTFCDVFGRRFLNSPVTGTIELVEIGMALVAFLAMPRAFYLNANVSADFINNLNLGTFNTIKINTAAKDNPPLITASNPITNSQLLN